MKIQTAEDLRQAIAAGDETLYALFENARLEFGTITFAAEEVRANLAELGFDLPHVEVYTVMREFCN